jgi:hypothetical protein
MELVLQKVHCVFGHYGACWQFLDEYGYTYDGSKITMDYIKQKWGSNII